MTPAVLMLVQALSASVCLAVALSYLSRRGGLNGMRVALSLLTLGTASVQLAILGASYEGSPERAIVWHAILRASVGLIGASGVGIAFLLVRPRATRVWMGVLGAGVVLAAVGVFLSLRLTPDHLVRTSVSWFPTANSLRVFDGVVVGTASLMVTAAALWRLITGLRYGRAAMWVLVVKQLALTISFSLIRTLGSPDLVQTYVVLLIAPSTLVVWAALHRWRAAGVDDSAFKMAFGSLPLPAVVYDLHTEAVLLNPPAETLFGAQVSAPVVAKQLGFSGTLADALETYAGMKVEDVRPAAAPERVFELRLHLDSARAIGLILLSEVTQRVEHSARLARALEELQTAQERLVQNEKMAALGVLVAGVNHEINNPLAYIAANLRSVGDSVQALVGGVELARQVAAEVGPPAEPLRCWADSADVKDAEADALAALREASDGTERIRELVSSMRLFSRQGEAEHEIDLADIARAGLTIGRTNFAHGVEVLCDLSTPLPVRGAAGELTRAVTNLVANAGQAMGPRGRLTVRGFVESGYAVVEVADDGPGVPPHLRGRIFDPFFTTKDPGQGTGLGLSISFETARRHEGDLRLVEGRPAGACFQLRVPLAEHRRSANAGSLLTMNGA